MRCRKIGEVQNQYACDAPRNLTPEVYSASRLPSQTSMCEMDDIPMGLFWSIALARV